MTELQASPGNVDQERVRRNCIPHHMLLSAAALHAVELTGSLSTHDPSRIRLHNLAGAIRKPE